MAAIWIPFRKEAQTCLLNILFMENIKIFVEKIPVIGYNHHVSFYQNGSRIRKGAENGKL